MNWEFTSTGIDGLTIINPFIVEDERGFLLKSFEKSIFNKNGILISPWEELTAKSQKGTIRGLHFQKQYSQDKLVRVIFGEAYDVAVDLRKNSPTFGQWRAFILSDTNHRMLYIPKGFAHGFLALSDEVLFSYLCGDKYDKESDGGIIWNDPEIGVEWPLDKIGSPIISEKDSKLPSFSNFKSSFGGFQL